MSENKRRRIPYCQLSQEEKDRINPRAEDSTALPPTVSQVAAIWIEDEDATELRERDIIVRKQEDGHSQKISYYYGCYDPLQYPLLFPSGEPGWHQGIKKVKASNTMEFCSGQGKVLPNQSATAEEFITTETAIRQENARKDNMVSAREFYAYRLQIRRNTNSILLESARLLQQFTVDMYVKIETSRLDYFRNNLWCIFVKSEGKFIRRNLGTGCAAYYCTPQLSLSLSDLHITVLHN